MNTSIPLPLSSSFFFLPEFLGKKKGFIPVQEMKGGCEYIFPEFHFWAYQKIQEFHKKGLLHTDKCLSLVLGQILFYNVWPIAQSQWEREYYPNSGFITLKKSTIYILKNPNNVLAEI